MTATARPTERRAGTSHRASVLHEIAARRRADVGRELGGRTLRELGRGAGGWPEPRDAVLRLARPGLHVIAEFKRRSPSAGTLADSEPDVAGRARAYEAGGAAAISVLVEPHWFGGSTDDLRRARVATTLPLLAKEFVVDARQLPLLRAAGADLVLLIAALQPRARLRQLVAHAFDLGLEPLVEAHDARELDAALSTDARIIGLNNRDLRTLQVDPERAERLRARVPDDRLVVAESGVRDGARLRRWRALGFDAALVGEELMRAGSDPRAVTARTASLVEAGRMPSPAEDPAAHGRRPFVKICGITEPAGLRAAIAAGADAVGLNFVPGTRRALSEDDAAALVRTAREICPDGSGPRLVGIFADREPADVAEVAARLGLHAVQLSGSELPSALDSIDLPVIKVLHLPAAGDGAVGDPATRGPSADDAAAGNGSSSPAPAGTSAAAAGTSAAGIRISAAAGNSAVPAGTAAAAAGTSAAPAGTSAAAAAAPAAPAETSATPGAPAETSAASAAPTGASAAGGADEVVAVVVQRAAEFRARPNLLALLLDTADATVPGGTGKRAAVDLAAAVARQVPVVLAGGLTPADVAGALRDVPAIGVDVAGGVERLAARLAAATNARSLGPVDLAWPFASSITPVRPAKDPFRVALFVKRARAARVDLPTLAGRPSPVDHGLVEPDARGRWGTRRQFGGRFVPETLMAALLDLEAAYGQIRLEPAFWAELRELGRHYVGRPTPLYRADRLAAALLRAAGRPESAVRLYLKREDLAHTGAHKINNALGQALLTRRLGKPRVIAETGAGQHGVATATACALLDLDCVVYMGAEDIRRQAPNVLRMRALGTEVREVTSGSATLKDAVNEAMRDWVTNVATTHYVLGSAVGPHPFPALVRDLQRVIGDEAATQLASVEGRLPDVAVACLGGGSNGIGLFSRFVGEPAVRLIGVEAAGEGLDRRHAAALAGGSPGVLHGARSYLLQDGEGQVLEAHSISAGLDYPGIGPQLSALFEAGRMEVLAATDAQAVDGVRLLARTEGILPALEPAHAIAALGDLLAARTALEPVRDGALVLLGLSGRGDKDLAAIADQLDGA